MTKKAKLLKDSDVSRWYTNVARGSPNTAEVHLRRLGLFCEQNGLTPRGLIDLGKKNRKELEDMIEDHITNMELEKKAPGYIAGVLKGVKSWLVHNQIELKRKIRVSNRGVTPSLRMREFLRRKS